MSQTKDNDNSHESTKDDTINNSNEESILEDKWMIRECDLYKEEYKECTSAKGRFHQYFIFGHSIDCNQWKKDYVNCCKWEDDKDFKAAESLINSEKTRRLERLKAHYRNDVWKKREAPPIDWDKPLPEWMTKRDENTYLAQKAIEIREGKVEEDRGFCSVM